MEGEIFFAQAFAQIHYSPSAAIRA